MYYNDIWKVEEWVITDEKECHHYNEEETPFTAVNVRIGDLIIVNGFDVDRTPITRWMTKKHYDYLVSHTGYVVL